MNKNGTIACAIRGPILMITLGTLIAFDNFDGYGFSRTWPILIIVFGLLKLFERVMDRAAQQAGPQGGTGVSA